MDLNELIHTLAPVVVFVVGLVVVGGVLLLRPLSRQLGALLEAMALEKQRPAEEHLEGRLSVLEERVELIDERQAFMDRLPPDSGRSTPGPEADQQRPAADRAPQRLDG